MMGLLVDRRTGQMLITSTTGPQPADFGDVRATNLAVVLRYIRNNAPCSRADIAAATGLNKATVSSLVADLLERHLVKETGLTENRIGRPATMLVLDGSPYAAIGMEVNVDHVTVVAVDVAGARLLSWRRAFDAGESFSQSVAAVAAIARRVVSRMIKEGRQVLGLTIAVPGLVDLQGVVRQAPNLGWRDADLSGDLTKMLRDPGFPIHVDNDATLAALAEQRFGPHGQVANLVYLIGELGVGAGVVLDGKVRRGGAGFSGEIGHIQLDPAGPQCRCGRKGCLETLAGIGALTQWAGSAAELEPALEETVRLARAGDEATLGRLERAGEYLGQGIAVLANLLNPEVVVLGGYYVPLARWLLPTSEATATALTIAPELGGCRVVASTLGYHAAALGGAARVLDALDSGRLPRTS